MAQFDVHQLTTGKRLVVDCQADLLGHLDSRLVVPLVRRSQAPAPAQRLNPVFNVAGHDYVMLTQSAAAVPVRELGKVVTSLADHSFEITDAIDVLLSGV